MPEVLIALTHNVIPTVPFVIEPQTPGMIATRRTYPLSGGVVDEGPFVPFFWPLIDTEDNYRAILTQCGLLVADSALVSVYVQDKYYNWVYMNASVDFPEIGTDGSHKGGFLQDFRIIAYNLRVQD